MLLYDIDVPGLDEKVGNSWNTFTVTVYFEKNNGPYNTSKEYDLYFKKWCELTEERDIDASINIVTSPSEFSYMVDGGRPIVDYIGILDVGTKVAVIAYGERYDGVIVGDGKPTMDDVAKYFGD